MVARYSYSRWDGTQKLALDAEELLDQLADRLIDGEDPRWALQRLMREGFQRPDGDRMQGLRELLEKIKQARQERLERFRGMTGGGVPGMQRQQGGGGQRGGGGR